MSKQVLSTEQIRHLKDLGVECPTYALQNVLDELPTSIKWHGIRIRYEAGWVCEYTMSDFDNPLSRFDNKELIDSAYNALVWCIENGYSKQEK